MAAVIHLVMKVSLIPWACIDGQEISGLSSPDLDLHGLPGTTEGLCRLTSDLKDIVGWTRVLEHCEWRWHRGSPARGHGPAEDWGSWKLPPKPCLSHDRANSP